MDFSNRHQVSACFETVFFRLGTLAGEFKSKACVIWSRRVISSAGIAPAKLLPMQTVNTESKGKSSEAVLPAASAAVWKAKSPL
jgi:hypothetical protein